MSKIVLNATTIDLVSELTFADIDLLNKQNKSALTLTDKNGDTTFAVMKGSGTPGCSSCGILFRDKDLEGHAVFTMMMDTDKTRDEIINTVFDKVGSVKANLDTVEANALAALEEVKARRTAFIEELDGNTAATPTEV